MNQLMMRQSLGMILILGPKKQNKKWFWIMILPKTRGQKLAKNKSETFIQLFWAKYFGKQHVNPNY